MGCGDHDEVSNKDLLTRDWGVTSMDDEEYFDDDAGYCFTYSIVFTFEADGDFKSGPNVQLSFDGLDTTYSSQGSWELTSAAEDNVMIIQDDETQYLKINSISSAQLSGEFIYDDDSSAVEFEKTN